MFFEDTNLKLTLISEDIKSYYTVRQLELENLTVSTRSHPVPVPVLLGVKFISSPARA